MIDLGLRGSRSAQLFLEHFQTSDTEGSLTSGCMAHQSWKSDLYTRKPGFIFFAASILVDPSFDLHALIFLSFHTFIFTEVCAVQPIGMSMLTQGRILL